MLHASLISVLASKSQLYFRLICQMPESGSLPMFMHQRVENKVLICKVLVNMVRLILVSSKTDRRKDKDWQLGWRLGWAAYGRS